MPVWVLKGQAAADAVSEAVVVGPLQDDGHGNTIRRGLSADGRVMRLLYSPGADGCDDDGDPLLSCLEMVELADDEEELQ